MATLKQETALKHSVSQKSVGTFKGSCRGSEYNLRSVKPQDFLHSFS